MPEPVLPPPLAPVVLRSETVTGVLGEPLTVMLMAGPLAVGWTTVVLPEPSSVIALLRLTFSLYVPAETDTVSPAPARSMPPWIVIESQPAGHTVYVVAAAALLAASNVTVAAIAAERRFVLMGNLLPAHPRRH